MGLRVNPQTGKLDVIEQKVPDDAGNTPGSKLDGYISVGINDGNGVLWFFSGDGTRYKIIGTPDSGTSPGQVEGSPMGMLLGLTYNETIEGVVQEGGVPYYGASNNLITDSANFFFDNINKRLGVKNNSPAVEMDITGAMRASKFEVDGSGTHLDTDGSNNLVFTDAVSGGVTLAQVLTAYNHSQDNTQAHSDYVLNAGGDTMAPKLTISDSASVPPLNITERSAAPSTPASGDIYLDDGTNTGSGNPGWRRYTGSAWEDVTAAAGGGSPGGSDTQLQYNNSSAFGGISSFTWDGSNLLVGTNVKIQFRDSGIFIHSDSDGNLLIQADTKVTIGVVGDIELGDGTERDLFPNTDGKINLGTSAKAFNDLFLNEGMKLQENSPTQLTAATNDWAVGQFSFNRLDTDGAYNLTGISGPTNGHVMFLTNIAASTMTLKHQSASSGAANRFLCNTGADISLTQNALALLIYDNTTQRWRVALL